MRKGGELKMDDMDMQKRQIKNFIKFRIYIHQMNWQMHIKETKRGNIFFTDTENKFLSVNISGSLIEQNVLFIATLD